MAPQLTQSEEFKQALFKEVSKQQSPFAICCVYINDQNVELPFDKTWHSIIEEGLQMATRANLSLVVDNENHMAIIVNPCSLTEASALFRIMRSLLLREAPKVSPNMAAVQVDDLSFDAEKLLTGLCGDLMQRVDNHSSRVNVTQYCD